MFFKLVSFGFVLINIIHAQECQSFNPSLAPISAQLCAPFLSRLIWVPVANPYAQYIIDQGFNASIVSNLTTAQAIVPRSCFSQLLSLYCNTVFQPCEYRFIPRLNTHVALPVPACQSVCETVNFECRDFWQKVSRPELDCNMTNPVTRTIAWPDEYYETTVEDVVIKSTCFSYDDLPKASLHWNGTCPYPLVQIKNPTEADPYCTISCPDPMFTKSQWVTLGKMEVACASASAFCVFFLCLYYAANPKCRKRKRIFELYAYLNLFMFCVSFLVGGGNPVENMWCISDTEFATFRKPSCGVQAAFFTFFALTTCLWLFFASANLFFLLTRAQYRVYRRHEIMVSMAAYGIPLILVGVPAEQGMLQYYWHSGVCFIQGYTSDIAYHFIYFYIPLGISILGTVGFTIATFVKLLKHAKAISSSQNLATADDERVLKYMNIRLLSWCAIESLIFLVIIIYRFRIGSKTETQNWVRCKVMSQLNMGTDEDCPESAIPNSVSFGETLFHYGVVSSSGLLCFLATGTNVHIYLFFSALLRSIWKRDWKRFVDLLTFDSSNALHHPGGYPLSALSKSPSGSSSAPGSPSLPSPFSSPLPSVLQPPGIEPPPPASLHSSFEDPPPAPSSSSSFSIALPPPPPPLSSSLPLSSSPALSFSSSVMVEKVLPSEEEGSMRLTPKTSRKNKNK